MLGGRTEEFKAKNIYQCHKSCNSKWHFFNLYCIENLSKNCRKSQVLLMNFNKPFEMYDLWCCLYMICLTIILCILLINKKKKQKAAKCTKNVWLWFLECIELWRGAIYYGNGSVSMYTMEKTIDFRAMDFSPTLMMLQLYSIKHRCYFWSNQN